MDHATEIAHRIMPAAGSEWPLSPHGRAIAVEHAANIIRAEMGILRALLAAYVADENRYNRGEGEPYGTISTELGMRARAAISAGGESQSDIIPEYADAQFATVKREAAEDELLAAGTHYLDANGSLQPKPVT